MGTTHQIPNQPRGNLLRLVAWSAGSELHCVPVLPAPTRKGQAQQWPADTCYGMSRVLLSEGVLTLRKFYFIEDAARACGGFSLLKRNFALRFALGSKNGYRQATKPTHAALGAGRTD